VVVGTLAGIAFGTLYVLAVHFEPDLVLKLTINPMIIGYFQTNNSVSTA
jgi:hypothetical protein